MSLINSFDKIRTDAEKFNEKITVQFKEIPVVFMSFDEPNADENFEHLMNNHPNPELVFRSHGVKGFDAAHKAAAMKAGDTERFFTIDADCKVRHELWDKYLELQGESRTYTFSWSSVNVINGLVYGNGGIKLWNKEFVMNMRTHEAAQGTDEKSDVEFCWDDTYKPMNNTYGIVHNNATAYQAFRAGFREGIKMGLDQGKKVAPKDFKQWMYPANYARWIIWMTVGADVENGKWAMYGSRLAAYKLYIENFDHTHVNDFDWFKAFWEEIMTDTDRGKYLDDKSHKVLVDLKTELGLPLAELDADQSIWFKHVHFSPSKNVGWPQLLNLSALPLYGFILPDW